MPRKFKTRFRALRSFGLPALSAWLAIREEYLSDCMARDADKYLK